MQFHGPSTAFDARKRQIGTNSKPKAAIAWNCWRPSHKSDWNHDGRGSNPAPVVFLAIARNGILAKLRQTAQLLPPPMRVGKGAFDADGRAPNLVLTLVSMQFLRRCTVEPYRLGVLPGTFNPVTVAHLALVEAALAVVD